jgi:hypothetical protein
MSRWAALLLALIGGAAGALAVVTGITVATYGVLWLYVFGDDSWPPWIDRALNIVIPIVGLALWAYFAWLIWKRVAPPAKE